MNQRLLLTLPKTNFLYEVVPAKLSIKKISSIIVDSLLALGLFTLLLIVFVPVALAITIESPGPIFFRQKRIKRGGKTFTILKFRSMSVGTPANLSNSLENRKLESARITKVGAFLRKTCIDELPQVINVFTGDMNVIGWRPVIPNHDYLKSPYAVEKTRPGITGIEQLSKYRNDESYRTLHYDRWYANKKCAFIDILIALKTIQYILSRGKPVW